MGKKIIGFVTRRNTSRGRKSKAEGGGGGINQRSWNYIHSCANLKEALFVLGSVRSSVCHTQLVEIRVLTALIGTVS